MRKVANLEYGTIVVPEIVCEDVAMFDPVLAVSQGGVRRSCFTRTRGEGVACGCGCRRISRKPIGRNGLQYAVKIFALCCDFVSIQFKLWQIHCAAPRDSLPASAASENFFRVLAVATDLGAVVVYVQRSTG